MHFDSLPLWWYIVTAAVALLIGKGLRWYWFRRKVVKAEQEKEAVKQRKIEMKRQKKLSKKAGKKQG